MNDNSALSSKYSAKSVSQQINNLSEKALREALQRCCASKTWVNLVMARRPFHTQKALFEASENAFALLQPVDWLQAFAGHPRIGDVENLRKKFSTTADLSEKEQAGAAQASEAVLHALAAANRQYEEKFGFIFIVCATGKSAKEMLEILQKRMSNNAEQELNIAAEEQAKITKIRLEQLT